MFKVVESSNGSTYVYSKDGNELLCVVQASNYPKNIPIGVSRPIPKTSSEAALKLCSFPLPKVYTENVAGSTSSLLNGGYEHAITYKKEDSEEENESEEVEEAVTIDKDYFEDCISHDEFLESLNLVSKKKLQKVPMSDLKFEFPYRNISRTMPIKPAFHPRVSRFSENVPMSCELMFSCQERNTVSSKYLLRSTHEKAMAIVKNEMFCSCAEHPVFTKLRCRDKTDLYPLTYKRIETWKHLDRNYCFSKEQTLEKINTIETGLTKRGHLLLSQCNDCNVVIPKVSQKVITKMCKRKLIRLQAYYRNRRIGKTFMGRLEQHPGLNSVFKVLNEVKPEENQPKYISPEEISTPTVSPVEKGDCKVVLYNVLWCLSQYGNACCVYNTNIKVKDVEILPASLYQPEIRLIKVPSPFEPETLENHVTVDQSSESNDSTLNIVQTRSRSQDVSSTIDLITVDKEDLTILPTVLKFTVKCYGCSFLMSFKQKCLADEAIMDHMVNFHSVVKPNLFLNTTQEGNDILIEAFPGLKV